jgi:hypothetical protein
MVTTIAAFAGGVILGGIFGGFLGILLGWRAGATHAAKSMLSHGQNLINAARTATVSGDCAN